MSSGRHARLDHARDVDEAEPDSTRSQSPSPAPVRDQSAVSGLGFAVQRKVDVGAVDDPLELEADRIAGSVVATLRRRVDHQHGAECGCSTPPGAVRRHAGTEDAHDEPATIGFAGGSLDTSTETRLAALRGAGRPLPDALRAPLEGAFGADLSSIRLHAGPEAADLNRGMAASAFTHGRDIYFRDGVPDTSTDRGLHLLAHELTHTVQQGSAPVRRHTDHHDVNAHELAAEAAHHAGDFTEAVGVRRSTTGPTVQRHAAYEHYLLGQLHPSELESIPAVRKIKKNKEQSGYIKKSKNKAEKAGAGLQEGNPTAQDKDNVQHLLDREMARLLKFRDDPEALQAELPATFRRGQVERTTIAVDRRDQQTGAKGKVTIPSWNVPVVVLKCADGEIVVSYSEMNTMPDLFGNPEAIEKTPKKQVLALLQGVRQQLYIELSKLREELFGTSNNQLYSKAMDGDFEGAQGPRSQEVNAKAYEIRTEKQVNSATSRKGEESEQYFAALERNACHFAPQSWHQWRDYHTKALAKAREAAQKRQDAQNPVITGNRRKQLNVEADYLANDAMVLNSFGEHYLQDSFASGHLIDKTKIMQWFAIWLEDSGKGMGTKSSAVGQWKMAVYAAGQNLQSNPQMLHDKMVREELPDAQAAQAEIGMQSSPEIEFMVRWRALAKSKSKMRSLSGSLAEAQLGTAADTATAYMRRLAMMGFASKDLIGGKYTLSANQADAVKVSKWAAKKNTQSEAYEATKGASPSPDGALTQQQTDEAVAEFNIQAYNMLLSNAYIGSSTKFFHDKFCKEGLSVIAGNGDVLGRIYGDANMLNAGGQEGVGYSAETSRMSRSSIFSILGGETTAEKYTTAEIEARFPKTVVFEGNQLPIVNFNHRLHILGRQSLFAEAQTVGALVVYKAMNGISKKGALDTGKLVKGIDAQVGSWTTR